MSAARHGPWPARDGELRARWDAGESTRQIADAMGLTKNSVVGRAHRLGLASRASPIRPRADGQPPRAAPRARREAASAPARPRPAPPPLPAPPPAPKLLPSRRCAWPLWPDGAGRGHPDFHRYCAAPTLVGSSYCPTHHARSCVRVAAPHAAGVAA